MSHNPNDHPQTTEDSAFWRGDHSTLWVLIVMFVWLIAASALLIDLDRGTLAWILFTGALLGAWLLPVLLLVPRFASSGSHAQRRPSGGLGPTPQPPHSGGTPAAPQGTLEDSGGQGQGSAGTTGSNIQQPGAARKAMNQQGGGSGGSGSNTPPPGSSGTNPPQQAGGANAPSGQPNQSSAVEQQLLDASGPPEEPVQ